jgi:Methyltransferase domain
MLLKRRLFVAGSLALTASPHSLAQGIPDLDVPYVTTPDSVVLSMLDMAYTTEQDHALDLGSGDGRIPITAALRYGASAAGVEIDPRLVALSQSNANKLGVQQRVQFSAQDLFAYDLGQASVITMYLLPAVNMRLRPALLKLKAGTRLVSHDWDMQDWLPDAQRVVPAPGKAVGLIKQAKLMAWTVPAQLQGPVKGTINMAGTNSSTMVLQGQIDQRFQVIEGGELAWQNTLARIQTGTIHGASFELTAWAPTQRQRWRITGQQLPSGELRLQAAPQTS